MKREIAEPIIRAMKALDFAIDHLEHTVRAIEDENERKRMLTFMVHMIHDLHMQITLPIVKHHPDLHPDLPDLPPSQGRPIY